MKGKNMKDVKRKGNREDNGYKEESFTWTTNPRPLTMEELREIVKEQ